MNTHFNQEESESNPYLPSGWWDGFYCYDQSPRQHKMSSELFFSRGRVTGSGSDDVSPFEWNGHYNLEEYKIKLSKSYATHTVKYRGDIDENGIWGTWEIVQDYSKYPQHIVATYREAFKKEIIGGFHIWPTPTHSEHNEYSLSEANESEKLKELFIEIFSEI